jgi:hypothetical protein
MVFLRFRALPSAHLNTKNHKLISARTLSV